MPFQRKDVLAPGKPGAGVRSPGCMCWKVISVRGKWRFHVFHNEILVSHKAVAGREGIGICG